MGLMICVDYSQAVSMELKWVKRSQYDKDNPRRNQKNPSKSVPIYISTLKKDINLEELRDLYSHCNHSCNRLSILKSENESAKTSLDMNKLRKAIFHSDIVVSVFCKSHHTNLVDVGFLDEERKSDTEFLYSEEMLSSSSSLYPFDLKKQKKEESFYGDLFQNVLPLTPENGQLVGFGRAYSDHGLTASIHDLMVLPSLQRMGIGKLIVNRIIRLLISRDIYDIAALCFEHERPFFKACGFGEDKLGSTTMMFTKSFEA